MPFKVAIVGGGLNGLAAALHLSKLGIDFVLLEARQLAPNVGASIALAPNGLAIVEQLSPNIVEDIKAKSVNVVDVQIRDDKGKQLCRHRMLEPLLDRTGGVGVAFTERQTVSQILYDHLGAAASAKCHENQKVIRLEPTEDGTGVRLHTEAGQTWDADVVLGADGIHSPIRAEMWRMAADAGDAALFAGDMGKDVRNEYSCVFGISHPLEVLGEQVEEGDQFHVHKKDRNIAVVIGKDRRPYWFVFWRNAAQTRGLDGIPRYAARAEDDETVRAMIDDELKTVLGDSPRFTFGDLYAKHYVAVPTAVPAGCYRRWHYGRVMITGDAAVKMSPISGQGGCIGLETTACIIDCLSDALWAANGSYDGNLTTAQVDSAFARAQVIRRGRARAIMESSDTIQNVSAWSNTKNKFLDTYVVPLLPTSVFVGQLLAATKGAYTSTTLSKGGVPVPRGEHGAGKDENVEGSAPAKSASKRVSVWGWKTKKTNGQATPVPVTV